MDKQKPGYIKIGAFGDAPVLLHWSFIIGSICVAIVFKAKAGEVIFVCSAYAALIISHEIGHAVASRIFNLKVFSIELSGVGGMVYTENPASRLAAFIFASAGVVAQIILFAIFSIYVSYNGWPAGVIGSSFAFVFIAINGLLILINLIPIKERHKDYGTDGYIIWQLALQMIRRKPYAYPDTSVTFSPKVSLLNQHGFVPKGFEVGIEIYNDNTTTMEFVIGALVKHLRLRQDKAMEMMLDIHENGGVLIPVETYKLAQEIAVAISDDAKREGYNLVCRPVDARHVEDV